MPLSSPSSRWIAAMLALLGPAMQAHADVPPATGSVFIRESTVVASPDTAKKGTDATPSPAPPPWMATPHSAPSPMPPRPKPRPEDAKVLLAILRNQNVCKLPLDLKVENATLEAIAARVQEKLPPTAPKIEVRDARPIRLSFAIKNSTVREVLESAAAIAGARLWVLPDRLLLAPQMSLTKADGASSSSTFQNPFAGGMGDDMRRVFSSLIADELTAKLTPAAGTTFDKLSPEAQEMLRGLVDGMNDLFSLQAASAVGSSGNFTDFKLSPTTVVQLNEHGTQATNNGRPSDVLNISEGGQGMEWATNGSMFGRSNSRPSPQSTQPPFLDPSAHKS